MTTDTFSGSPEEKIHRSTLAPRSTQGWEDGPSMPKSPMAYEQLPQVNFPPRRRGAPSYGLETSSRSTKAPTLSNLPTPRHYSGRSATEKGTSLTIGQHRSPYSSASRFFLTVIPPVDLPHDPPHPRSQASTSSSAHIRRGTLLPLFPTLGGQLYAISREYGLPSIGGLAIYLCDDGEGNLGPRVGDATWSALWSRFFDEDAEDIYQNITSSTPQRMSHDHERDHSRTTSSDMKSPYGDSMGLRREEDGYEEGFSTEDRRPSSSLRRTFGNGHSTSPMPYNTPSPRGMKFGRSQSRSSFHTPVSTQARLPIVGRIEWTVDKKRAPWWSNWIGEADVSSDKSVGGSVSTNQVIGTSTRGPGRRSMHLTSSLNRTQAESPNAKTAPLKADDLVSPQLQDVLHSTSRNKEAATRRGDDDVAAASSDSEVQSSFEESNLDLSGMGYEPIEDEKAVDEDLRDRPSPPDFKINGLSGLPESEDANNTYENQSYAGYSALLGVDDDHKRGSADERASMRASMLTATSSQARALETVHQSKAPNTFDPNILAETDGDFWRDIHQGIAENTPLERLSAEALSVQEVTSVTPLVGDRSVSAVHDWISKTQSPQAREVDVDYGHEAKEEVLLPPQDDVGEVIGLWAEKGSGIDPMMRSSDKRQSAASLIKSNASFNVAGEQSEKGGQSRRSSARVSSAPSIPSPPLHRSPLQPTIVRLAELPEEPASSMEEKPLISKVSLLSPIALDHSPSTFPGPSANLSTLLGHRSTLAAPNAGPSMMITSTPSTLLSPQEQEQGSRSGENRAAHLPDSTAMMKAPVHQDSMMSASSPRLELPSPRSPDDASPRSSSTDASDTLLDMERALALLSPAASNHFQGSPAMDGTSTTDSTYESGAFTSSNRGRLPFVSSRDSMAKAKTLSTSVTPSPRWFRNTTVAMPHLTLSATNDGNSRTRKGSQGEGTIQLSPRPVSAFAGSSKHRAQLAPWDLQPPLSSSRMVANMNVDESREEKGALLGSTARAANVQSTSPPVPKVESPEGSSKKDEPLVAIARSPSSSERSGSLGHDKQVGEDVRVEKGYEGEQQEQYLARQEEERGGEGEEEEKQALLPGATGSAAATDPDEEHNSVEIYDSPSQIESYEEQRLQPGNHLGRQGWSQTTVGNSQLGGSRSGNTTYDETDRFARPDNEADLLTAVTPLMNSETFSTFSPRSNEYATVGVQAERDDQSRTNSIFSLVSDDAPSSERTFSKRGQEEEEEEEEDGDDVDEDDEEEREEEKKEGRSTVSRDFQAGPSMSPPMETTPMTASVARMGSFNNQMSDDIQPSIQRMIRGFSFAESSEASSSKDVSPYLSQHVEEDETESQGFDWSKMNVDAVQEDEPAWRSSTLEDEVRAGEGGAGEEGETTIENRQEYLLRREHSEKDLGDDATTTRGREEEEEGGETIMTSARSEKDEDWSQGGSEYGGEGQDDDDDDDDDDEGDEGGSPSTRRSHNSVYSYQMGSAGGRTPTFLYDHHLVDDDSHSRRSSQRLSGNPRGSKSSGGTPSQRLSRRSLRASDAHMQDALGVGLSPTRQYASSRASAAAANSAEDYHDRASFDVHSLAGEMLSSNDDRMLHGFEQVAQHPGTAAPLPPNDESLSSKRESMESTASSNSSEKLKQLSEFTARAIQRDHSTTSLLSTTSRGNVAEPRTASPSLFFSPSSHLNAGMSTRRSMGSVLEDVGSSPGTGRRASASATSPSKSAVNPSPSPRKLTLRMANDGTALMNRNMIASSPKQRFRALPPSPSFLPMSPSSANNVLFNTGLSNSSMPSNLSSRAPSISIDEGVSTVDSKSGVSEEAGLPQPSTTAPVNHDHINPSQSKQTLSDYA
ncbi:hypothetical protein CBS101457_002680 [Exobasidium rhododendri]|nr:hypothetical protein CBS101457_002680 [Exobasidium rhododendri]